MIYFDNAATTMQKPPEVTEAVVRGLSSFGGVGRGVHPASLAAGPCGIRCAGKDCALVGRSFGIVHFLRAERYYGVEHRPSGVGFAGFDVGYHDGFS